MFASGVLRHQAPSTPSPNAVSAAPSGRGLAAGSRVVTPRATVSPGSGAGADDPQPTAARAAAAITALPARLPPPRPPGQPPGRTPSHDPIMGPAPREWRLVVVGRFGRGVGLAVRRRRVLDHRAQRGRVTRHGPGGRGGLAGPADHP